METPIQALLTRAKNTVGLRKREVTDDQVKVEIARAKLSEAEDAMYAIEDEIRKGEKGTPR